MADILRTGLSGLLSFRHALGTAGHNVNNAHTPDFSRQRVELATAAAQPGSPPLGGGVRVAGVERLYDGLLAAQLRERSSGLNQAQTLDGLVEQLQGQLGDGETGLAAGLQSFFAALQDVTNTPTSTVARQVLLTQAEGLAGQFSGLNTRIEQLRDDADRALGGALGEVNRLARSLAEVNGELLRAGGAASHDLFDRRDRLLSELAELVETRAAVDADGRVDLSVAGQPLLVGTKVFALELTASAADPTAVSVRQDGLAAGADLSGRLSGGRVGAYLQFRDQILGPAQNRLGRLAVGLAETFNQQHRQGVDLGGAQGGDFFRVGLPRALADAGNAGSAGLDVGVTDVGQLQASDYELRFDGSLYRLRRLSDGELVASAAAGPLTGDGLSIDISGGPAAAGDRFLIQPLRRAAAGFSAILTRPEQVAAAAPATQGAAAGDNRNALALAELQNTPLLGGGTLDYQAGYTELVGGVAAAGARARDDLATQGALLASAEQRRAAISGVNLDEEAADLLRFQQAYEASAQVIRVADTLFQTLINATRG